MCFFFPQMEIVFPPETTKVTLKFHHQVTFREISLKKKIVSNHN